MHLSLNLFPYLMRIFRRDGFLLTGALLVLFCFISVLLRGQPAAQEAQNIYLSIVLPLITGMLSAYVIVGDPLFEQISSTPFGLVRTLFTRLGIVVCLVWLNAVIYQAAMAVLGFDLSALGPFFLRQISWFLPAAVLMSVGVAGALIFRQNNGGAVCVGVLLIMQTIMHVPFIQNPWMRLFYLLIGFDHRPGMQVWKTQMMLCLVVLGLFTVTVVLLRRPERYIVKG